MTEHVLDVHIPNITAYSEDWEANDWKGMPYAAFEKLARMFPAPCQELYVLKEDDSGTIKTLLIRRPESDKHYGLMWHNPGTAHRSTDGVTLTSSQNVEAMRALPRNVLLAELAKSTCALTPRDKGLHRVLSGAGIRFSSEDAFEALENQIQYAGLTPLELTPRGIENAELNVLFLSPKQADSIEIEYSVPEDESEEPVPVTGWFDVTELYDMAQRGEFIQHQVNRFAMMMDSLRATSDNEHLPVLRRIEPLSLQELLDQLGIDESELSKPV